MRISSVLSKAVLATGIFVGGNDAFVGRVGAQAPPAKKVEVIRSPQQDEKGGTTKSGDGFDKSKLDPRDKQIKAMQKQMDEMQKKLKRLEEEKAKPLPKPEKVKNPAAKQELYNPLLQNPLQKEFQQLQKDIDAQQLEIMKQLREAIKMNNRALNVNPKNEAPSDEYVAKVMVNLAKQNRYFCEQLVTNPNLDPDLKQLLISAMKEDPAFKNGVQDILKDYPALRKNFEKALKED